MNKIIFEGKASDGTPYLIRYPEINDLQEIWQYINDLSREKTFINYQGDEITLEDERKWLNAAIRKNEENTSLQLFAESNGKIISSAGIEMQGRAQKHLGYIGLSVTKEFRGKGIGKKVMEVVMDEGKKNLVALKIIYLDVFGNNPIAIGLYKSLGFKEYGKLPGGLLYRGQPQDEILMYYEVKT